MGASPSFAIWSLKAKSSLNTFTNIRRISMNIAEYCKECPFLTKIKSYPESCDTHGFVYIRYRKVYLCKETDCEVYPYKSSSYWGVPDNLKRKGELA
jgi:hypothetical protein